MKSIWIKIGNKINDPKSWIRQGYIGIINIKGINDQDYDWLESPNGIYNFATKLNVDDVIYIFTINNGVSQLKYKFVCNSDYMPSFHGYYIKNIYKCLDIVTQFTNGKNGRHRWAAKGGLILNKCNNPNIQWDLIKNTNQVNLLDQEVADYSDEIISNHKVNEGELIQHTILIHNRSQKIKDAYLEKYGSSCKLCGKSYLKADGTSYILDIHHLKPIASGERETNIDKDLKGLCPNCHRFVHSIKGFENKSWDEIEEIFKSVNNK